MVAISSLGVFPRVPRLVCHLLAPLPYSFEGAVSDQRRAACLSRSQASLRRRLRARFDERVGQCLGTLYLRRCAIGFVRAMRNCPAALLAVGCTVPGLHNVWLTEPVEQKLPVGQAVHWPAAPSPLTLE